MALGVLGATNLADPLPVLPAVAGFQGDGSLGTVAIPARDGSVERIAEVDGFERPIAVALLRPVFPSVGRGDDVADEGVTAQPWRLSVKSTATRGNALSSRSWTTQCFPPSIVRWIRLPPPALSPTAHPRLSSMKVRAATWSPGRGVVVGPLRRRSRRMPCCVQRPSTISAQPPRTHSGRRRGASRGPAHPRS